VFGCALWALGCAGSQPPIQQPSETAVAAPGQLQMRNPDAMPSPLASARPLGTLDLVKAAQVQAESPRPHPVELRVQAPIPIRIDPLRAPRSYALHDSKLVLPAGLIVHRVPKGVAVRIVQEQGGGEVWEIVDARGRRLALLRAESLGRGAPGALLPQTAAARQSGQRTDWGAARVKVVADRFLGENHVYTIERRAEGTAWIWSGLELSANAAHSRRAE
jgi:hypothetical protein